MKDGLDPFDSETAAALKVYEMGQLQDHAELPQKLLELSAELGGPLAEILASGSSAFAASGLGVLVSNALKFAARKEELNIVAMFYYVAKDLARVNRTIKELDSVQRNRLLFFLGTTEARTAQSEDKVRRLAAIAVSGMLRPDDPPEIAPEFLRITSALSETDILVLTIAANKQLAAEPQMTQDGDDYKTWRKTTFESWSEILTILMAKGISDMSSRSALTRLQSHGLVEAMDPGFGGGRSPCEVLELGRTYLDYLLKFEEQTRNDA